MESLRASGGFFIPERGWPSSLGRMSAGMKKSHEVGFAFLLRPPTYKITRGTRQGAGGNLALREIFLSYIVPPSGQFFQWVLGGSVGLYLPISPVASTSAICCQVS